jgi:PAS domain S-box-containing protein
VLLGVLGIVAIAIRETLGALDVARYARRVEQQEAQFRSLVAGSTDVIMVLDGELMVRWQSAAAARQFGLSDQDVVGRHFPSMLHPADATLAAERLVDVRVGSVGGADEHPALVEARLRDGFGQWRETEFSISDQRDVPEVAESSHIRDIGERQSGARCVDFLYADSSPDWPPRQMQMSAPRCASPPSVRRSCSSWMVSLPSMTCAVMTSVMPCWWRWPAGCGPARGRPMCPHGSPEPSSRW